MLLITTRLFLFVFALFFAVSAKGQYQYAKSCLKPFTDYSKCYHGLKTNSGKVVWNAEFNVLEPLVFETKPHDYYNRYWVAEKAGLYGLLSDSGKVVLPFAYSELRYLGRDKYFIGVKNGVPEIYSPDLELLYTAAGYDQIRPMENGYLVQKNGKSGFLDSTFKEHLPPLYDDIDFEGVYYPMDAQREEPSTHILSVEENGKRGIYDLNIGWVVPCTYRWVECHWVDKSCTESEAFYEAFSEDFPVALFNSTGKISVPLQPYERTEVYFYRQDYCAKDFTHFGFIYSNDNSVRVVNVETGKQVTGIEAAMANGNRLLFKQGKEFGVLDENLNELARWKSELNLWFQDAWRREAFETRVYSSGNNVDYYPHQSIRSYQDILPEDNVVTFFRDTQKKESPDDYEAQAKRYETARMGLYNYITEKSIPANYHYVNIFETNGEKIFWAVQYDPKTLGSRYSEMGEPMILKVDIYDAGFKKIKTLNYKIIEYPERRYEPRTRNFSNELFFIYKEEDQLGAIDVKGNIVVPFEYLNGNKLGKLYPGKDSVELYRFSNAENLYGVVDSKGKQILPFEYQEVSGTENALVAKIENKHYNIFSPQGKLLLEDVNYYTPVRNRNSREKCLFLKDNPHPEANLSFFIKGDRLYYMLGDELHEATAQTFDFSKQYLYICHGIWINQEGKVVDVSGMTINMKDHSFLQQFDEIPVIKPTGTIAVPVSNNKPAKPLKNINWKSTYNQSTKKEEWRAYDKNDHSLSTVVFRYPFPAKGLSGSVCKVGEKYGVLDTSFHEVIETKYDYIFPQVQGYLLLEKGKWTWAIPWKKKSSETFDAISLKRWNNKYLVFDGGKIGILTDSLTVLVPLTDSAEMIQNMDLIGVLGLVESEKYLLGPTHHLVVDKTPADFYRKINNRLIVQQSYAQSTAVSMLQFDPLDHDFASYFSDIYYRASATEELRTPVVTSPWYYSEKTVYYIRSFGGYYAQQSLYDDSHTKKELLNYKIVNGTLIPITLKDLLKDNAAMNKLDNLLMKKLNEIQAFGQNCTDINERIKTLKEHFLLGYGYLGFYWQEGKPFEIYLSFSELKGIILSDLPEKIK